MDNAENTMQAADAAYKRAIDELNGWKGFYLVPRYYCQATFMPLGNASVKVEYEVVSGQAIVLRALINGMVLDAEEVIPAHIRDAWEQELTDAYKRDQSNF
ncbi:MAG: hypothetical protein RL758_156 [Pseudomonadota bacterium]|jgi:hypothetical protein